MLLKPLSFGLWPAYVLLIILIVMPVGYDLIKLALLTCVLFQISITSLLTGRVRLHPQIMLGIGFYAIVGLAFGILGIVNGNSGTLLFVNLYVTYPLVYLILLLGIDRESVLTKLTSVLIIGATLAGLYGVIVALHWADIWPEYLFFKLEPEHQKVGINELGLFKYSLYSVTSLAYLVPFLTTAALTWRSSNFPVWRVIFWAGVAVGFVALVLSGRRTLIVLMIIPFIFAILYNLLIRDRSRSRIIIGLFALMVCGLTVWLLQSPLDAINSVIGSYGLQVRIDQAAALIAEWQKQPLLGLGLGGSASDLVRSYEDPWSYELSYLVLLMNTGIVGSLIYLFSIIWIYWMGVKVIAEDVRLRIYMFPALSGLTVVLIANATNPYLNNFSFLWFIFYPVAIINLSLLNRKAKNQQVHSMVRHGSNLV